MPLQIVVERSDGTRITGTLIDQGVQPCTNEKGDIYDGYVSHFDFGEQVFLSILPRDDVIEQYRGSKAVLYQREQNDLDTLASYGLTLVDVRECQTTAA